MAKKDITHGMSKTRIYRIWKHMKERCNNPKEKAHKYYGGRGITYDQEWEKFENFFKDMQKGYADNLTIDRIDVNGNYNKKNCRWIPRSEQTRNSRSNIKYKGECASEACRRLGVSASCVKNRIYTGWSIEDAFTSKKLR